MTDMFTREKRGKFCQTKGESGENDRAAHIGLEEEKGSQGLDCLLLFMPS